jgi:glucokinase
VNDPKVDFGIGIDLGGSSVKTVAVSSSGEAISRETTPFDADESMDWAEKIRSRYLAIEAAAGRPPSFVGLSAPGLAAPDGGSIAHMPGRLQGLENLQWREALQAPVAVPVLNDAHAALLGECWLGAARGYRHVILYTLGTGVGGAAMIEGRLLRGNIGRAGHLGHMSLDPDGPPDCAGTPGSVEVAMGNCTILERSGGKFTTTHQLVDAFAKGDADARRIWLKSVKALAAAICSAINILDPQAVVIGGGIARAGDLLFEPLRDFIAEMEWRPGGQRAEIIPAQLGEYAGAFGSAWNALQLREKA